MATLYPNHIVQSAPLLRDWLDGSWGLLFSHPIDFEDCSFERDRWLEVLRADFKACGVRPIAYRQQASEHDRSWVSELLEDTRSVYLTGDSVIDLAARQLRDKVANIHGTHFVLVVDDLLSPRALLRYGAAHAVISPLDLLATIRAIRRQSAGCEAGARQRRAA